MTHDRTGDDEPPRADPSGAASGAECERRRSSTLTALCLGAGLGASLSGCTGSDPGIAFGPNGPVPSVDIASVSTNGAPLGATAPLRDDPIGQQAPQRRDEPQYAAAAPVETVQRVQSQSLPPVRSAKPASATEPPKTTPWRTAALSPAASAAPGESAAAGASAQVRGGAARTEVQFLPLIGVPQAKAELLAGALSRSAAESGVAIRPAAGAKTDLRLKGYFSAFNDGTATTLVYVWDVLDRNDQRTHRIQGQETVPGKAADPWSVVDGKVLDAVATKTLNEAASYG